MLQPMLFNVYSLPKGYSIIQSHANLISTLTKREKKESRKTSLLKMKMKLSVDKEANRGNLLEDREREKQLETAVGNKRPITISLNLSLLDSWDNSCWRDNCVGERSSG